MPKSNTHDDSQLSDNIKSIIADEMELWLKDNMPRIIAETLSEVPNKNANQKSPKK